MAVGYRSSSVTGATDAQDAGKNCPVPTGAAANDIALLAIEVWLDTATDPVITWPSGFTQKIFYESTTDGFQRMFVGWKRLTGADTGNYAYTISGSYWNMAHCILMTGAITTGDPIEVTDTQQAAATTAIPSTSLTTASIPGLVAFVINENAASQTPPTSYAEVQDGDYVHTSYRLPGTSGSQSASGGSLSGSNAVILAALLAVIPDAATGPADAGLWAPASGGIVMPQSSLYFPFTTPWASADVTVQAATGTGDAGQRSSTQALVVKAGSGTGTPQVRSANGATGSKSASQSTAPAARAATSSTGVASQGATGVGVASQRTVDQSTGQKSATGTASDTQRSTVALSGQRSATGAASTTLRNATTSTGKKSPTASGVAVARASTASAGRKGAASASSIQSRAATGDTGVKAVTGTAQIHARAASQETGNSSTGVTGSGAATQRAATTSTGVKGGASASTATCRSSAGSTGVRGGSGSATVMARPASATTGLRRTSGAASVATRPASSSTAIRRTTGTATVRQRSLVVCTGAQVIPPTFGTAHSAVGSAATTQADVSSSASASAGSMTVPTATGG